MAIVYVCMTETPVDPDGCGTLVSEVFTDHGDAHKWMIETITDPNGITEKYNGAFVNDEWHAWVEKWDTEFKRGVYVLALADSSRESHTVKSNPVLVHHCSHLGWAVHGYTRYLTEIPIHHPDTKTQWSQRTSVVGK
jgi:hypothetical protein